MGLIDDILRPASGTIRGANQLATGTVAAYAELKGRLFALRVGTNPIDLTGDLLPDLNITISPGTDGSLVGIGITLDVVSQSAVGTGATVDITLGIADVRTSSLRGDFIRFSVRGAQPPGGGSPYAGRFATQQRQLPASTAALLVTDSVPAQRTTVRARLRVSSGTNPLGVTAGTFTSGTVARTAESPLLLNIAGTIYAGDPSAQDAVVSLVDVELTDGAASMSYDPLLVVTSESPAAKAPEVAPSAAIASGSGSIAEGTYSYRYTWVTGTVESPASDPSGLVTVETNNARIQVTGIPTAPANTFARLYRSRADDAHRWQHVADLAPTAGSYDDALADPQLGADLTPARATAVLTGAAVLDLEAQVRTRNVKRMPEQVRASLTDVPTSLTISTAEPAPTDAFGLAVIGGIARLAIVVPGLATGPYKSLHAVLVAVPRWLGLTTRLDHPERLAIEVRGATQEAGTGLDLNRPGGAQSDVAGLNVVLSDAAVAALPVPAEVVVVERQATSITGAQPGKQRVNAAISGLLHASLALGVPKRNVLKGYARDLAGVLAYLAISGRRDFGGEYPATAAPRSVRYHQLTDDDQIDASGALVPGAEGGVSLDIDLLPTKDVIAAIVRGAVQDLRVVYTDRKSGLGLDIRSPRTASTLDLYARPVAHFEVAPSEAMSVDTRVTGIATGPYRAGRAIVRLLAHRLLVRTRLAKPIWADVQVVATGPASPRGLGGVNLAFTAAATVPDPPTPEQALVVEQVSTPERRVELATYPKQEELWIATTGIESANVAFDQPAAAQPRYARSGAGVVAGLVLTGPFDYGGLYAAVPDRSLRVFQRTTDTTTGLDTLTDVRASEVVADANGRAELTVDVLPTETEFGIQATGRLRRLRARAQQFGRGEIRVWSPLTAPTVDVHRTEEQLVTKVDAPMAVNVDIERRSADPDALPGIAARLVLDADEIRLDTPAGTATPHRTSPPPPRRAGTGSTSTVLVDAAGDFHLGMKGMTLEYTSGVNKGVRRRIRRVRSATTLVTSAFPSAPDLSQANDYAIRTSGLALSTGTPLGTRAGLSGIITMTQSTWASARENPQLRIVSRPTATVAPGDPRAIVARVEQLRSFSVAMTASGRLVEAALGSRRRARSFRIAHDVEDLPFRRLARVLLANVPDSLRLDVNEHDTPVRPKITDVRMATAPAAGGWVWGRTVERRETSFSSPASIDPEDAVIVGIGVTSYDIVSLPRVLIQSEPSSSILPVPTRFNGGVIAGYSMPGNMRLKTRQIRITGGSLRLARMLEAHYDRRSISAKLDLWLTSYATVFDIVGAPGAAQAFRLWQLSEASDAPDRGSGVGADTNSVDVTVDLDIFDHRHSEATPGTPSPLVMWNLAQWTLRAEMQMAGSSVAPGFRSFWLVPGGGLSQFDGGLGNSGGFWFLRASNSLPGIGDAYFGNTAGNFNGRTRLFP